MSISEMCACLERAMAEVQVVEAQLNDRAHSCTTCGLTIREDFSQYQMREGLTAVRNKLQRFVGSLHVKLGT